MTDSNMILKFQDALSIVKPYLDSVSISIKTSGGGSISKIYAVRQAICRGILAYVGKNYSEDEMVKLKDALASYDKSTLNKDNRRIQSKQPGRKGADAGKRKSYR